MREPKSAADRADLLMAWYEGHTIPSMALRDEIIVQLRAYAQELQRRLEDAGALHLADETTIRQLERRLEAAVSHHEDGGEA